VIILGGRYRQQPASAKLKVIVALHIYCVEFILFLRCHNNENQPVDGEEAALLESPRQPVRTGFSLEQSNRQASCLVVIG
jgi:hypothetical protein